MKLVEKFNYQKLEQITYEDRSRKYITPDGDHVPSVTTVLGQTGDKSGLKRWAEWVGEKEADKQRREAGGLGSLLHSHLEAYIEERDRPAGNNVVRKMARDMSDVMIERGLSRVTEIWGIEKAQYFPALYAGTADLIGCFENAPAIMDYKTSKKMKKDEHVEDYKLQVAAYSIAHNEIYGTNIKTCAIFMVGRDLSFKTYVIDGLQFQKACNSWHRRLEEWFANN
ncbi:MAG: preprotein translocase subunit TatA [Richelia sp. RM2_1_2]|nr:preprotein translocase subunit TatA [Richelia sp. RM2_1_2]